MMDNDLVSHVVFIKFCGFIMMCVIPSIWMTIEYRSDDIMVFCYNIVMVPNKKSLHQASGSGLEPGTCIVNNCCDH